jgi:hypothetical protein
MPMESEIAPPSFLELPGYAPSPFEPQVLVQPLDGRISFLDDRDVSGIVYVKGVSNAWELQKMYVF